MRGLRSKIQSLNSVNNLLLPDIVTLNEHGITGKNKVNIENYKTFTKNRHGSHMGGVSISVPDEQLSSYVKVKEGVDKDECIIIDLL